MHTWPQKYTYGASDQEASASANGGDYYREYEMGFVLSATVNNLDYASQMDWLLLGDMNSRSRVDNWYYGYGANSTAFRCQDVVRNNTNLVDVIAERYPGEFHSSTYGGSRIDYVYASPSMYGRVRNAMILTDAWTDPVKDTHGTSFYLPSDHRPILVDFDM